MNLKSSLLISILFFVLGKSFGQNSSFVIIEHVNVIPMTEEKILYNQRVFLADGKIFKIEPDIKSSTTLENNSPKLIIDGKDKYLIPGLSEMHYHFRSKDIESDFKLLVANGITTVRNMSEGAGQDHIAIRRKTISGDLMPLNYFTTGPYLQSKDLQSESDVIKVVQQHKKRGYDFLKIADNLPKYIYLKLLEECQVNNIPVVGHTQRNLPVDYSVRMKSIEHIEEFLYLSGEEDGISFYTQDSIGLKDLAVRLRTSGIYIGTTLSVFEFILNCLEDKNFEQLKYSKLTKFLARDQRDAFLTDKNDYRKLRTREFDGLKANVFFGNYFKWIKQFSKILSNNKVLLLTGSDTYGMVIVGFSLHREFELLQEAGLKPFDILLASTVNPARYLNTYAMEGTISEGKNANLVLLKKNPLEDIKNTQSIEGVFLKGKWFDKKSLQLQLEQVETAFK
jgi:hypothetical protein